MGPAQVLNDPATGGSVLTDRNGRAVIWWPQGSGIAFRERPPGGSFGSVQTVPVSTSWSAHLVANPAGDLAAVWYDGTQFQMTIRPAGGSFGAPSPASPPLPNPWYTWGAALGGNRELTIAWSDDNGWNNPSRVRATHRGPAGELHAIEALTDGTRVTRLDGVASGDSGRAVVGWQETDDPLYHGERYMALRDSGAGFGARRRVASQGQASGPLMAADGTYGLVSQNSWGMRVSAAPFGQKLQRVKTFVSNHHGDPPAVALSPSGRFVLGYQSPGRGGSPSQPGPLVAVAAGGSLLGPIGPLQDVPDGCPDVSFQRVAVNDSGQSAALYQSGTSVFVAVDDPAVAIRQQCLQLGDDYNSDPENQPARGGPGGGTWTDGVVYGAGPYGPGAPGMPSGPSMAPAVLPDLKLSATKLSGKGAKRTTRVTVTCGSPCSATAAAEILPRRGEPLAEGQSKARTLTSGKGRISVTVRLSARARRALASSRTRRTLKLRVAVSAVDTIGRRRTQWVQATAAR